MGQLSVSMFLCVVCYDMLMRVTPRSGHSAPVSLVRQVGLPFCYTTGFWLLWRSGRLQDRPGQRDVISWNCECSYGI